MLTESRLVYLMVYVNDLTISRAFYEETLGLSVLEEDDFSVKYDAGHIMICLNRAEQFGVSLPTPRDPSAALTFLVEDLDKMRESLEARGVVFTRTQRYEIGASTDFFDPDGHWFMLYEPSDLAMNWPSGEKIRAVLKARSGNDLRLNGKALIYLFLFIPDHKTAFDFYHGTLGLRNIEGGACKSGMSQEVEAVIKYDTGGILLTTHKINPQDAAKRKLVPRNLKGIAPVFHVTDGQQKFRQLSDQGVRFSSAPAKSAIGTIAKFEDPFGRPYYIYEPSQQALGWPSGAKIRQILAATL